MASRPDSRPDPRPGPRPDRRPDPRALALDVLNGTLGPDRLPAEALFDRHPATALLSARDRAFARLLYTTCLRHLRALDAAIAPLLERRPKELERLDLLRLGAVQLLLLETPPHAAVMETVALARRRAPRAAGLVNAVLRKLVGTALPAVEEVPEWLLACWRRAYGDDTAASMARAVLRRPPLDLTCPNDPDGLAARLGGRRLGAASVRTERHGAITEIEGYEAGTWWVQDVAAASIVPLLGDLAGRRALDLCAAPGGKTAQLVAAGAEVTAVDRDARRMAVLRGNLERLGMTARTIVADAGGLDDLGRFDVVLLDAPCTATGTIRRHPDILRHRRPGDMAAMLPVQARLLDAALDRLAPGGVLLYAVCSLQPEEGPEQIDLLVQRCRDLEARPIDRARLHGLPFRDAGAGRLQSLPCDLAEEGGLDGFFVACLSRPAG
ncbi:MAG: RsmB/NOP family class I SAM-dependent RNA methyltransferase [Geminicoccaceae bacterium]|nr:RsmB/NOP family class I SAM-dependent RNA methyltransferase [Geminicoccaceae bacterium]